MVGDFRWEMQEVVVSVGPESCRFMNARRLQKRRVHDESESRDGEIPVRARRTTGILQTSLRCSFV